MVEYCGRCKRRRIFTYRVREDIQRLALLNRWKSGVCAACFDELAEKGGIPYSFEDIQVTSWSDRGAIAAAGFEATLRKSPRRGRPGAGAGQATCN